jgi:hypothetical protein
MNAAKRWPPVDITPECQNRISVRGLGKGEKQRLDRFPVLAPVMAPLQIGGPRWPLATLRAVSQAGPARDWLVGPFARARRLRGQKRKRPGARC